MTDPQDAEEPSLPASLPPAAPFAVVDPREIPLADFEARANDLEPVWILLLAELVRQDGREEDALTWMAIGRVRALAYRECFDFDPSGVPALTSSIHFMVRQELDPLGREDFGRWQTAIDRAIAWETTQPVYWTNDRCQLSLATYRETMVRLRDALAERTAQGDERED